jgi:hypothetical protein
MVIQQELQHQLAGLCELLIVSGNVHAFRHGSAAGRLVLLFPGNGHHTQPTVFQWAQQWTVAKHGNVDSFLFRNIKDGTPSRSFHCLTINTNLHRTLHVFLQNQSMMIPSPSANLIWSNASIRV